MSTSDLVDKACWITVSEALHGMVATSVFSTSNQALYDEVDDAAENIMQWPYFDIHGEADLPSLQGFLQEAERVCKFQALAKP